MAAATYYPAVSGGTVTFYSDAQAEVVVDASGWTEPDGGDTAADSLASLGVLTTNAPAPPAAKTKGV